MAERLQYLIEAIWQGGGATQQASASIANVGHSIREADIRMAAAQERSSMLGRKMSELGREVAKGNLSVEEASKKYNEFENSLADVGAVAQRGGSAVGALTGAIGKVTLAFGAVVVAGTQAYDFLKEGAQLELARSQFDNLALSINSTGDALLSKLRQATRGLQTDAELVQSASDIISVGLAKNETDVVRLANVIGRLGLDMQQVILTFANNSKARLDSLGLSVEQVTKRQQELISQGHDLDQAFDLAVLEGLEGRLNLLGDAADSAAGRLERLETRGANALERLKQRAIAAVDPIVAGFLEGAETIDLYRHALERGIISQEYFNRVQANLHRGGPDAIQRRREIIIALIEERDAVEAATDAYEARREGIENNIRVTSQLTQEIKRQHEEEERHADAFTERLDQYRRGVGIVKVQIDADTEDAERELEDLINDYSGRVIPIEVLPTLRGRGPEKAQGEEVIRPAKEALKGIFDEAVVALQPQIDMTNLIEMESQMGNIIENVDYVNRTTVAPRVINTEAKALHEEARSAREELSGISDGSPYEAMLNTNLVDQNIQLGQFTSQWLQLRSKRITLSVDYAMGGAPGGNPFTGPYDTGGAGGSGGGSGGGPQANAPSIVNNFYGVSTAGVIQELQNRGLVSRTPLR